MVTIKAPTTTEVNDALTLISAFLPQAATAYQLFKVIWTVSNPGKTEADYLAYLTTASQQNITDADAILKADGYVQDASGNWSKPAGG